MGADAAQQIAGILKALADPLRLRMLSLITTTPTGEACVCDLATVAAVSMPTVSHHLKVLKDVGVLSSERRGTWVYYRVNPSLRGAVTTLLDQLAPAVLEAGARQRSIGGLTNSDPVLDRITTELIGAFPA
ncbi:MAG: metalloregulator ArsR/SmtB family transcription factor, partial [Actinobacteria bacterium]|nr:metalloregulator ArsR/SmtB family transcription factor [Actinomycetota bacterium]